MPKDCIPKSVKAAPAWEEAKARHPQLLEPFFRAAALEGHRLLLRRAIKVAKVCSAAYLGGTHCWRAQPARFTLHVGFRAFNTS